MSIKPKVAIITVYYNRRDHVVESVKSLLNQTYVNLEVVIVDDCSTDDTFDLIKETVADSTRVNLKRNEHNKGFTQTLIDTIKDVDAKYIAIHGAGDISLPTRVEEQVNHLEKNLDVGVVTTDITNLKKPKFHKTEITLQDLLKKNRITHGAVMFRRKIYDQVGGYRSFFTTRQDIDLWYRMIFYAKANYINKKLYSLIKIKNTVSQNPSKIAETSLMSGYVKHLMYERLKFGRDSLETNKVISCLSFDPRETNPYVRRIIFNKIKSMNFNNTDIYIDFYLRNNKNFYNRLIFGCIKLTIKLINKR